VNELECTNLESGTINDGDKFNPAISFKMKMRCISLFTACGFFVAAK